MKGKFLILAIAALIVGVAIVGQERAPTTAASPGWGYEISILSSSPDMVSGGDALVRVDVPKIVPLSLVRVLMRVELNGADVTAAFKPDPEEHALVGLVNGFVLGKNTLQVKPKLWPRGWPALAQLRVTNYPITGPIFSGPQQYPFVCQTEPSELGQPLVDNLDHTGFPVYAVDGSGNKTSQVIGWSKDCSAKTRVYYMYRTTGGKFLPLPPGGAPADLAQTTTLDGRTVPYVVRLEQGTIDRFIYSLAMLAPLGENPERPDDSAWNGRLVYSFDGGVGIGHSQGKASAPLLHDVLSLGYAVATSTGNITGVHYNLQVGGEAALMVKERFIERHGVPYYTVGIGGSGGGIQQYVYGQNHPGLLDAAIPQYEYPDMVTQTIHVGDCELLEYYMDVTDGANPKWKDWKNRVWLEGMNASNTVVNPYTGTLGASECIIGWRGLTPLAMNPLWHQPIAGEGLMQPAGVMGTVKWTHWDDLRNIYGIDEDGYAMVSWDNVGVQYGLQALLDGHITPAEFLKLNANVGTWKEAKDMVQEGCPFVPQLCGNPAQWDPWSSRNMNLSPDGGITPAPRREGSIEAMNAAYESGMVFDGKIDIPIIDWRHYLEDALNMHNTHQSFATRQRMIEGQGDADNQVIWFTDARPAVAFDQTAEAFRVMDQWMANIKANPDKSVAKNKPTDAVDRCFNTDGSEFARGDHVWDGILNDEPDGACTQKFPLYSTARIVAGGPLKGGIYKCQLQTVENAIVAGVYGSWVPDAAQRLRLKQIFPTGVCDYSLPDAGRPAD
jgi:hypothetical protein